MVVALVAALALPCLGSNSRVRAADSPDVASQASLNKLLKGTYAFGSSTTGSSLDPSDGTFTFDGKGGLTGVLDMDWNGTVCVGMTLNGTYLVNSNRTATADLTLTSVNTANCANKGDTNTLTLSMSFSSTTAVSPATNIYFAEMDQYVAGAFSLAFNPIGGEAILH
jgi:hypothetical protein